MAREEEAVATVMGVEAGEAVGSSRRWCSSGARQSKSGRPRVLRGSPCRIDSGCLRERRR